jgi:hypothetical protein
MQEVKLEEAGLLAGVAGGARPRMSAREALRPTI